MKKYFKTQLKKSISLFMAVLMVLSCWVWVAPEAEAVNEETNAKNGQYYVQVYGNLSDWSNKTNLEKNNWIVTYKTNNGTGSEATVNLSYIFDVYNNGNNAENVVLAAGWVPGFPTKVRNEAKVACEGDAFSYQPRSLRIGGYADNTNAFPNVVATYSDQYSTTLGEDIGYDIFTVDPAGEHKPVATSVRNVGSNTTDITVPAIGSNAGKQTSNFTLSGEVYDQYGVRLLNNSPESYVLGDTAGTVYTLDTHGIGIENGKIVYNENAQIKLPNTSGRQKVYIFGQKGSMKSDEENAGTLYLKYPSYTMTVNPSGSTGKTATMEMTDGTGTTKQTTNWTLSGVYGTEANASTKWPTGNAEMTGYTFKGFWSNPQPSSGEASYFAYEAEFAAPVSSDDFVKLYGGTEGGTYVEKDGKKYYNAGTQWSPSNRKVQGGMTFYGWWISTDITATFYDIDGKYLGSSVFKYGMIPETKDYPDPKDDFDAGAFKYNKFEGVWQDISGIKVTEGVYEFGPDGLTEYTLTPTYSEKKYQSSYTITFVNPVGGNISANTYDYRACLGENDIPTAVTMPSDLEDAIDYSYAFKGWTANIPANGKYHIVDAVNPKVTKNEDWIVRADATYYPIFERTIKQYRVAFTYTDSAGDVVTKTADYDYGSVITTPSFVNRTYAKEGKGYDLEAWNYNGAEKFDVDGDLLLNESNVTIEVDSHIGGDKQANISFDAKYSKGEDMPYTIKFTYFGSKGEPLTFDVKVNHGDKLTAENIADLSVPAEYDDGEYLYRFANRWKVVEGVADYTQYIPSTLTTLAPVSNVTFEAVYNVGIPFRTVRYVDGTNSYSDRITAGSNIPAWMVDSGEDDVNGDPVMKEYVPADIPSATGTYKFAGWFDEAQTDKEYKTTNGKEYTKEDIVTNDLVLHSQFIFEPFKFAIKFVNWDGTVLAEDKYEAGESFKAIYDTAMDTAAKSADATYSYAFIGWDNVVPDTFKCEGKDMTYTAQYKPSYIYYKARWYQDKEAMDKADLPELETVGQGGLLAITSYTYEGAVYAPSVDLTLPTGAPAGETYVFAGWKYLKDGVEADYVRGMTITSNMSFYATYTTVKNAVTVTTVVGDERTDYKVEYNSKATAVGTPVDGYKDENNHQKFAGWYTDESYGTEFDIANTAITANITIYAKFDLEAHTKDQKEIISVPTYYAKGSEKVWCACSKEETAVTTEIAMLTDTVAPTGTIYLGTQGKWSSTDSVGAAATDNDPVTLYVNADTDIILTINDTGDVSAYNTSGVGKGIANIQGIISTGVFGADTTEIAGIQTIFTDDSDSLNNTANYVIRLGSYKGLVSGQTYIAYYYAVDKAGNQLNRNVRTAKFIYDNVAPVITIEGDNNVATAKSTVTYCAKATVVDIEDGATVTVNGTVVAATDNKYVINQAGNYLITVTDKAGNSTSKKIIVNDGHDEVTTEQAATCTVDGYKKISCAICNKTISSETYTATQHNYEIKEVAPTCTEDGYTTKTCTKCGEVETIPGDAKLGHTYIKDADSNNVYVVVVEPTCSTKGKEVLQCTVCDAITDTREVAIDADAHVWGEATKVLKPTCTEDGYTYKQCRYCYKMDVVEREGYEKLNHVNTGIYTKVTTAATCYSEGVETTYCKACNAVMGTAPVAKIAHTLTLVTHDEVADKTEEYPNGYMQYECQVDGCNHTEGKQAIAVKATYTVTFKGAGAEGADLTITKTEGETIAAGVVADQTKAQDEYNKYTFAGWKGSDGKVVKLPVKVTKNETYTAEFTATKRTYTHIFKVNAEDETAFATILGAYKDEYKKPLTEPKKAATDINTYEFDGWKDVAGKDVEDFTMTGDKTFVAKFKAVPVKYSVIFYDADRTTVLYNVKVDGGAEVTYVGDEPTKEENATYHYTFAGWEYGSSTLGLDAKITNITETTRLYAKYTEAKHTFETVVGADKTWAATCTTAGQKTEKCDCGYVKVTEEAALGHDYSIVLEDGSKKCSRCEDTIAPEAKMVTITFVNDEGKVLKTVEVEEGKTYTFTAPAKDSTVAADFTFFNWVDESGAKVCDAAEITVTAGTANATYKAVYTANTRSYNVVFVNADGKQLYYVSAAYGSAMPAYKGATPEKAYDANYHYAWANSWMLVAGESATEVKGNTRLMAEYTAEAHSFVETETAATCQQTGGLKKVCSCGLAHTIGDEIPKLDHKIGEVVSYKAPQLGVAGSRTYICSMCKQEFTESIPALASADISILVYNYDGELAKSATVELWYTVDGELVQYVANATGDYLTDANGAVSVTVPAEYSGWRAKVYLLEGGSYNEEIKTGTLNVIGAPKAEEPEDTNKDDCSCSCHKNTFWGFIFRLFQKIVKLFAGKAKCCSNPDSRI